MRVLLADNILTVSEMTSASLKQSRLGLQVIY